MSSTNAHPAEGTSGPLTALIRHPLKMRRLTVRSVRRPTPRLVSITLGGDELEGFVSAAPDDHVKVLFPAPGSRTAVLPEIVAGQVRWESGGERPIARDYTPVRFDPHAQTLDLEIVVHAGGLAAAWAERAEVGDVLGVAGPRGSRVLAMPTEGLLLAGDETALPAIGRWLGELPATASALAVIAVADAADERPLPSAARATVRWVHRRGAPPGESLCLAEAVARCQLPDPLTYAWIAGEAGVVKTIARDLMERRGVPRARVSARGYWKRGVRDHQEPHED